jgi:Domain of unknown function (DUF4188)
MVERSIAWLVADGCRRVPYHGIQRNDLWWSLRSPRSTCAGCWPLALPAATASGCWPDCAERAMHRLDRPPTAIVPGAGRPSLRLTNPAALNRSTHLQRGPSVRPEAPDGAVGDGEAGMATIHPGRHTAEIEGDFVVFLIGMRLNRPWKVHQWLPVFTGMQRMPRELARHPSRACSGPTPACCSAGRRWCSTGAASSTWSASPATRRTCTCRPGAGSTGR